MNTPLPVTFLTLTFLVLCCLFVIGLGVYLLITGWRGRKLDDHPVCRKCRFDLFGLPTDTTNCPECGQNIANHHHIQHGNRRRSRLRVVSGLLLVGFVCLSLGGLAAGKMRRVNWLAQMPNWFLQKQVELDSQWAARSWAILAGRLDNKQLAGHQLRTLLADALELQADMNRTWDQSAGELIEKAYANGTLSENDWQQYCQTALDSAANFQIRKTVEHGQHIAYRMTMNRPRLGSVDLRCINGMNQPYLDKQKLPAFQFHSSIPLRAGYSGGFDSQLRISTEEWQQIKPGDYDLKLEHTFLIVTGAWYYDHGDEDYVTEKLKFDDQGQPIYPVPGMLLTTKTFHADLSIKPVGTQIVTPIKDESLREAMTQDMKLEQINILYNGKDIRFEILTGTHPKPYAHEVYMRVGDEQLLLGRLVKERDNQSVKGRCRNPIFNWWKKFKTKDFDQADILLIPSEKAAAESLDITEYWDHEIVFKDVPVIRKPEG